MPRILAIDYGKKRTGIAITDNLQIIAYGLTTVPTDKLLDFLSEYCHKEQVELIVMGKPIRSDGTVGEIFNEIKIMAQRIKGICSDINVVFFDEAYTSKNAVQEMIRGGTKKKYRRKKENIDKMAAALLLQNYLQSIGKY